VHIAELIERKRQAAQQRGQDYLTKSSSKAKDLLVAAAAKGYCLRPIIAQLEKLLSLHGKTLLDAAIEEALNKGVPHPNAVRVALERQRELTANPSPAELHLSDPRLKKLLIKPHPLSNYAPQQKPEENHE
jgi:hypothetical protein